MVAGGVCFPQKAKNGDQRIVCRWSFMFSDEGYSRSFFYFHVFVITRGKNFHDGGYFFHVLSTSSVQRKQELLHPRGLRYQVL